MKGYIGFSTSRSWISKVINFVRKSEFSHCFVILGQIAGEWVIGEAMEYGVRLAPLKKYLVKNTKVEIYCVNDVHPGMVKEATIKIMDLTGRLYGFFQLIGFVWVWLMDKFGVKKQNPFTDGIICSEYVYYYLKYVGFDSFVVDPGPNDVAPDSIRGVLLRPGVGTLVAVSDFDNEELKFINS